MSYYIKKENKFVTDAHVSSNGVLIYYLVHPFEQAQEFNKLEADMFLALVKRSVLLTEKEKELYKTIKMEQLWAQLLDDESTE